MDQGEASLKKIENPVPHGIMYSKWKDALMKQAAELDVLCGVDIGVIMFSPTGQVDTFASNGRRLEDIILRYVNEASRLRGDPEYFNESLKQQKYEPEPEVPEKLIDELRNEDFEKELMSLKNQLEEAKERLRIYKLRNNQIKSLRPGERSDRYFLNAIKHMEDSRKRKGVLTYEVDTLQQAEIIEIPTVDIEEADWMTEEFVISNQLWGSLEDEHIHETASLPMEPYLNIGSLEGENFWNLPVSPTATPLALEGIVVHETSNVLLPGEEHGNWSIVEHCM